MNPVHRLIELYKISESTLTGLIPNLSDEEIVQFISSNRWVVIPTSYEKGKKESINRPDPNMYISLRHEGKIELGIVCNTLASIQRMKNIFSDFHSQDKGLLIEKLGILDDDFKTTLEKKSQLIMPKHQFMKLILKYNQILWMKKTSRCCLNELKKF